jgi:hypothetical protein
MLAWPAAAQADQRFAAPTGAGASCTQANPCSVQTAIDAASGVDEVILAGGSYGSAVTPLTTPLSNGGFVSVRGAAGEPMPRLFIDTSTTLGSSYALELGGGSLADVAVTALGANDEGVLARSFDHVSVLVPTGRFGCWPSLSMTDTACVVLAPGAYALYDGGSEFPANPVTLTLDHDTLFAPEGTAAYLWPQNFALTVAATDTIFAGGAGIGEYDIDGSNHKASGSVHIEPSYDRYGARLNPGGLISGSSYHTVITPPTFANPAAGDVHEASGSSTIDAGTQDDVGGNTDLGGGSRWIGAAQDIGAYEAPQAPRLLVFHAAHDGVDVQLNPNGADTTVTLDYGPTASYGSSVSLDAGAASGGEAETLPVAGFAPGSTFHYQLSASNVLGSASSGDQTFAAANERFAAPAGLAANPCTVASPCDLATAVNGAANGQEILLAPGSYGSAASPLSTPLSNPHDITIEGDGATPRLFLATPGSFDVLLNGFSRLAHVQLTEAGASDIGLIVDGTIDHALVVGEHSNYTCGVFFGSAVVDSACVALGAGDALNANVSSAGSQAEELRLDHDTFFAANAATAAALIGATGFPGEVIATDTIFRGPTDIQTLAAAAPASVTVSAAYSDYATVSTHGEGSVTAPGSATDIAAAPLFVSLASGDVHEAPGSPTIDAGVEDPFGGLTDLDGNPRTIGRATDIGAFEAAEAPTVAASGASAVTETTLSALARVNPNFSDTQVHVEYGSSMAYGSFTPASDIGAGIAGVPVSFALAGLAPGTVYHLRVVATNAFGTTAGPDVTVTTASPPSVPLLLVHSMLAAGVLSLPRSATVRGSVAQLALACTPARSRGCRGRLRLLVYKRSIARHHRRAQTIAVTVGTSSLSLGGGQRKTIDVRLSAAVLDGLRKAKGHRLSVQLQVIRSDGGTSTRRTLVLQLAATGKAKRRPVKRAVS